MQKNGLKIATETSEKTAINPNKPAPVENVFAILPFNLVEQSTDYAKALQILNSIVDVIPFNESQNQNEPITPRWRQFLD